MARALLKQRGMPATFWGEAVVTAVYILNRSPTKALDGRTPYEAWHGCKPAVFHRAIDVVPCWQRAFEALMELGFARVLTSGQARTAPYGADTIAEMVRFAAGRLQVLPGGGVRLENAAQLLRRTGCGQIHLSCRASLFDQTMPADGPVRFNADSLPPENVFKRTDRAYFAALKQVLSVNCPPGAGCAGQDT